MSDLRDQIAEPCCDCCNVACTGPNGSACCPNCTVYEPEILIAIGSTADAIRRAEAAEAERDRLEIRIDEIVKGYTAVNAIHNLDQQTGICHPCRLPYPCPTVRALDGIKDEASAIIAERDQLKATIERVRELHHLTEWVSLSDVCARHHWFRQVEPNPENIAVADVCPDCKPRRYMNCVCAEDPCPVLTALNPPTET